MLVGMAIFYGGIAQAAVGIMEWKQNNEIGLIYNFSYAM